ncbi:methyl-accepting chemotaxis protein, partial [Castellaniella ginsengisoli]
QMDDVTRQNASLVEESAAAAASLQEQADTLARLAATFTLDKADAGSSAQAARPAQPARLPSAPEKVVSPAPQRPRQSAQVDAPAARAAAKPALRAPGKPAPASADTEEWTEF